MASDSRIYKVAVRRRSSAAAVLRLSLFFGTLTFWIGLSRVWFGGAWVIDLFAAVAAVTALFTIPKRLDDSVAMTKAEMRQWLDAGCPDTWGR